MPGPGLSTYVDCLKTLDPGAVGANLSIFVMKLLLGFSAGVLTSFKFSAAYEPGPGFRFFTRSLSRSFRTKNGATLDPGTVVMCDYTYFTLTSLMLWVDA